MRSKQFKVELIYLYWLVGEQISKQLANASCGDKTIDELAHHLKIYHPEIKGFNLRGLYWMRQFYETYATSRIVSSVMTQLEKPGIKDTLLIQASWTHHLILLSRTKTEEEREYYLRLCIQEKYSVKELERQINSSVFERVMLGNQNHPPALKELKQNINNVFKDSYIFEFLNIAEPHSEGTLQKALITQMKNFILELGRIFCLWAKNIGYRWETVISLLIYCSITVVCSA